jgi:excisionase family DNA binding protein
MEPLAPVTTPEPLAVAPAAAAAMLGYSKRTISRLISAGKIEARKDGGRTLVDVVSLKAYYASLPKVDGPAPLACSIRAPVPVKPKRKRGRRKRARS